MITRFRKGGASQGFKSVPRVGVSPFTAPASIISAASPGVENISAERRLRMISEAAYFRSERRGFAPGGETEDWIESEAEVEQLLATR
ncbi:MAG TPA: DUF2934 domain-containing protein [Burkholderiales bacterium]